MVSGGWASDGRSARILGSECLVILLLWVSLLHRITAKWPRTPTPDSLEFLLILYSNTRDTNTPGNHTAFEFNRVRAKKGL